jgi:DNA-binding NarL/FixJ family response regulator
MEVIKVLVADDHHLVRQGICALLNRHKSITVVGEAADGREAVNLIKQLKPDIALMDIAMPLLDGLQATRQITAENLATKIIILSMHSQPHIVVQVLQEGAKGYLLKECMLEEVEFAIQAVIKGRVYLSPPISNLVVDNFLMGSSEVSYSDPQLTAREHEVLQLLAEGNTNKQAANILTISVRTVEKHRANIMKKLNVSDFASLISESIKQGLVLLE